MDLGSPGADLLGPAEAAALRVMARQARGLSGRDVARLAGTSASTTRRALLRLARTGLVSAEPSSHAHLYRVQREHVLWEPVRQVLTSPAAVRVALARWGAQRLGDRASLALFGSVARGDADADSDVDLALVFADVDADADADARDAVVDELRALVESLTGNPAQVFAVDRSAVAGMVAGGDPLVASWRAEAVTLSGPDLVALLGAAPVDALQEARRAVTP